MRVYCEGFDPIWDATVMAEGAPDAPTTDEVRAAFLDALEGATNLPGATESLTDGSRTPWRMLDEEDGVIILGTGTWTADGPGDDGAIALLTRTQHGVFWIDGGLCLLRPEPPEGHYWLDLERASVRAPDPAALYLTIVDWCVAMDHPRVLETDEHVVVGWTAHPEPGVRCAGELSPPIIWSIPLDSPLGDRQVLDASLYPPQPVRDEVG